MFTHHFRRRAVLVSLVLWLFQPGLFQPARAADQTIAASDITLIDDAGHLVQGIICDNLRGTPPEARDRLLIQLPEAYRAAQLTATLENPDGGAVDTAGHANAGTVEGGASQLLYYPPDEFNFDQQPGADSPLTTTATRSVVLRLTGTLPGGATVESEPKTILLARPTVVLVHGINTGSGVWDGRKQDGLGVALAQHGFAVEWVEHGIDDFAAAADPQQGALFFKGEGPVESGAALLGETIAHTLALSREHGFAARRVDVVAYSYGGVIARWYLQNARSKRLDSRRWYVNSNNVPGGADLYWLPTGFMDGTLPAPAQAMAAEALVEPGVRKLITMASMWRGVPLANYVNEVHGPPPPDGINLAQTPLRLPRLLNRLLGFKASRTIGQILDSPNFTRQLPIRAPAFEVMAVNSLWLEELNRTPFRADVAYGAVAGDNDNLLYSVDAYSALHWLQRSAWFPYLKAERRSDSGPNITDGVVPLWSAVIPGSTNVVAADHASIIWNLEARRAVLAALSSATLPQGRELNALWGSPIVSRTPNTPLRWEFDSGAMAPPLQNELYQRRDGVARVNPLALREIRLVRHDNVTATSATIFWQTALPTSGLVRLYTREVDPGTSEISFRLRQRIPDPAPPAREHRVTVQGLKLDTTYFYVVEAQLESAPGQIILLSSDRNFRRRDFTQSFTTAEP